MMGVRAGIEFDLRLALNRSIDFMVLDKIGDENPPNSSTGDNALEEIIYGIEVVLAAGYSPSVLAASPAYMIALDLMEDIGTGDYLGNKMAGLISRLRRVVVPGLTIPIVMDAAALGTLYASPARLSVHEENDGASNTSLVRYETTATFVVQRVPAAVQLTSAS